MDFFCPTRITVHCTAIRDCDGAALVLNKIRRPFPWPETDLGRWGLQPLTRVPLLRMKIVRRSNDMKSLVVLPRRWVAERTFSWFGRNRRLA